MSYLNSRMYKKLYVNCFNVMSVRDGVREGVLIYKI